MNDLIVLSVAVILDQLFGDPEVRFHPVRLVGNVIQSIDNLRVRWNLHAGLAGAFLGIMVPFVTCLLTWFIMRQLALFHPLSYWFGGAIILWTTIGATSMIKESRGVLRALDRNDLDCARGRLGRIVGRDTGDLSRTEISRATVESLGEGWMDGWWSPIFWFCVGGVPAAVGYRVINTLDAMVGYRRPGYRRFGRVSARLDDFANWIPARLSVSLIALSALLAGYAWKDALRVGWRDRGRHDSPNAGHPEATFAGALGCRLGGLNKYQGTRREKPLIHPRGTRANKGTIRGAIRLFRFCVVVGVIACVGWLGVFGTIV